MRKALASAMLLSVMVLFATVILAKDQPPAGASASQEKAYVCPKCDAAFDKPGKCPCGQELKAVNKSDIYYQCDACKATSDKPGKCPKCNVDMKLHVKSWEKAKTGTPS
jgi:hypothetical protein